MEIDIAAESTDKKTLLIGEVKWTDKVRINEVSNQLITKSNKVLGRLCNI